MVREKAREVVAVGEKTPRLCHAKGDSTSICKHAADPWPDCVFPQATWQAPDDRVYVEIRTWDSNWMAHVLNHIIGILGSQELFEQVWVVVRLRGYNT